MLPRRKAEKNQNKGQKQAVPEKFGAVCSCVQVYDRAYRPIKVILYQKSTPRCALFGSTEPLRYSRRRRTRKKVVATVSRCERVYKRTGEPSVPFCERGGTTARVTDFSAKKNRNGAKSVPTWCG